MAWTPGDAEPTAGEGTILIDGLYYVPNWSGCFHDANGNANIRVTCGDGTYMGILGTTRDIAALDAWASKYPPDAEIDTPSPPGICYGEPGGLDTPD